MQFFLFALVLMLSLASEVFSAKQTTLVVQSINKWNTLPDSIPKGTSVKITVPGSQTWTDWYITKDANGYQNSLCVPMRYVPAGQSWCKTNIFKLVCCVAENLSTCKEIGTSSTYIMPSTGQLSCFANDADLFYWNNKGSLNVAVSY